MVIHKLQKYEHFYPFKKLLISSLFCQIEINKTIWNVRIADILLVH